MENLIGRKFGRLLPIEYVGKTSWGNARWLCKCDCGNEIIVSAGHLKSEHTRSCGCWALEERSKNATRHGLTKGNKKPRLFIVWNDMKQRCFNPKAALYYRYGGRGITVCAEWLSFETFYKWAMANGYAEGLQIDRIDNDKGYFPENCRFVTPTVNARNTSRNRRITICGETKCISEWLKELHVCKATFYSYLKKDPEKAYSLLENKFIGGA